MFRLKEQQLHMLMWMMVIATVLFFGFLGLDRALGLDEKYSWKGMEDFSDGWICTYETTDMEKLKLYQRGNRSSEDDKEQTEKQGEEQEDFTIVDVVTFPSVLAVQEDTTIQMSHKVPDMNLDTRYVTLELDNATVKVYVEEDIVYASGSRERMIPVRHIIPISPKYEDKMMTIEISDIVGDEVDIKRIQSGIYNQLWVTTLQENGVSVGIALVLICMSLCMLLVWVLVKNTWQQKRLLCYATLEGLLLGLLCLLDGQVFALITGWNYGTYILKACGMLLAIVLHLTIIRCFIYKKKVLTIVDTSVLLVGVLYISVMVLQAFSLVYFDTIYQIASVLYCVMVGLFTVVLAITIFDYKRREGMPVFVANIILVMCMLAQVILYLAGRQTGEEYIYMRIGFLLYMLYIWVHGLRQAFYVQMKKEEAQLDESKLRAKVVEQMNPNLLFASFHSLQSLIKNGSDKSVKMIYYISVYFRDNLKALESEGETISFKDELEHIIAYLQLQRTRNHNLDFAIECKVKEFNVPRHSVEPFVENAVKHGIANHQNRGNIAIRTYTRADGYAIQIIDDGAGFDTNILKKKSTTMTQKLMMLEKTCHARTEVISKEGKGTVITIVLPMLENDLLDDFE